MVNTTNPKTVNVDYNIQRTNNSTRIYYESPLIMEQVTRRWFSK